MAAPNPPQQLCVPDRTFFQFPNQIPGSLCEKKFEDYVSHLQDEDAAQVVDWLDNVRLRIVFFASDLVHNQPRFYALWILQVLHSGGTFIDFDGYAALGEYYRDLV